MLLTSNRLHPSIGALGDGPLQEQRPRHRVQPLRGLRHRQDAARTRPFADLDVDTARGIIAEVAKLAEGPLAASFADADRNPPVFDPDTNSVTLPESFKKSFKTLYDSEWWRLETMPELGGQLVPRTLVWAVAEQVLGSNPALHMYMAGAPFAGILYTQRQRDPEEDGPAHDRPRLGRDDGADRARRGLRRRRRPHQGRSSRPTARGTSRASSASSPRPSTTSPRTSSTWCWPAPRAPARAPRACRCSSCRSSTSTPRPASSASATAPSSPTSSTRWASRPRPPASCASARSTTSRPRAGSSATCTTASRRCSRSSSTPA